MSQQNIFPNVLGIIKIFSGKCETSLCVLFGQQWLLPWNSPMDAIFAQSLSHCWIMNTDLNWGKWGLLFFRCCSGFFFDLLDESSFCSWSNFGKFSPFVDNGSDCGSLESQSFINGFDIMESKPLLHCKKIKMLGKLKSLRQPASADFWVFSTSCFKFIQQNLRNILKNKLRKLKKYAEAGCLKLLSWLNLYFFTVLMVL